MVPQKRDLLAPVGVHPKPLKLALMGGYINGWLAVEKLVEDLESFYWNSHRIRPRLKP